MRVQRVVLVSTLLCAAAFAQDKAPEMPADQKKLLDSYGGKFTGEVTVAMGDQKSSGKMTYACERTAGGGALLCKGRADLKGMGKLEVTDLFGFNPADGTTHVMTVNSMGEVSDSKGKWTDEKTLVLRQEGTLEGKPLVQEITQTWTGPKEVRMRAVTTVGGQPAGTFEAVMKKK
jgi:hypothetical protein